MLPPMREELALHPGPVSPDGSPSWTLHDPVRNSFYRIAWPAFEILARWGAADADTLCNSVNSETTLTIDRQDVTDVYMFLAGNELITAKSVEDTARLVSFATGRQQSWYKWLLHHYLFIRIPLVRPDRLLDRLAPFTGLFYSRAFFWTTIIALFFGLAMIFQQWDVFRTTLVDTLTPSGFVSYALSLTLVKMLHECGHAFTAKRLGCRVPTMGVAFLVMWPVLFTDVNETWRLPDRRDRLAVGVAGIAVELAIAAWSTVLWVLLPDGPLRQMTFLLAAITWLTSLTINLSPFMRFDGYFLLMDAVNIPNLHTRAFNMARWWVRETLFGLNEEPPEAFSPGRRRFLIIFAFAVWIYRLSLFLAIAAIVYHFFIKFVGILLFMIETSYFIVLPIIRELIMWKKVSKAGGNRTRMRWTGAVVLALVLALILPWHHQISASAMLKANESQGIYIPVSGTFVSQDVADGAEVNAGQRLFAFQSTDAAPLLAIAEAKIQTLDYQLRSIAFDAGFREQTSVLRDALAAAYAERTSLRNEESRLTVRAPTAGTIVDIVPGMHAGDPISPKERLATLRSNTAATIEAYVTETELGRIAVGDSALFYPDAVSRASVHARVVAIDRAATTVLDDIELAHTHGGTIEVRGTEQRPVPEAAIYRVRLAPDAMAAPAIALRGIVRISGQTESILGRTIRSAAAVVLREWGS